MSEHIHQTNPWEYTPPGDKEALRYLSIAVTTMCNFRCSFCSKAGQSLRHLDTGLLYTALREAMELGLEKVEFTGGEPLLYPGILDLIDSLKEKGITALLVTNGSLLGKNTARRLARAEAMVAVSLSTLQEQKFHQMTGTKKQYAAVHRAIHLLKDAGFSNEKTPLIAIQSIASRETAEEIPLLQNWAEEQGCLFIINRPIPVGAMDSKALISPERLKELLDPGASVPFSLDSPCNRLTVGCYIGTDAIVRPCPCIDLHAGNLQEESLTSTWKNSPLLNQSRNIQAQLQGSCGVCPENRRCYGCRAVAYAVFGKLTAPDPGCFRYNEKEKPNSWRTGGKTG